MSRWHDESLTWWTTPLNPNSSMRMEWSILIRVATHHVHSHPHGHDESFRHSICVCWACATANMLTVVIIVDKSMYILVYIRGQIKSNANSFAIITTVSILAVAHAQHTQMECRKLIITNQTLTRLPGLLQELQQQQQQMLMQQQQQQVRCFFFLKPDLIWLCVYRSHAPYRYSSKLHKCIRYMYMINVYDIHALQNVCADDMHDIDIAASFTNVYDICIW